MYHPNVWSMHSIPPFPSSPFNLFLSFLSFFLSFSPSSLEAPRRAKIIPVCELTPTAVTSILPLPSITWVPVMMSLSGKNKSHLIYWEKTANFYVTVLTWRTSCGLDNHTNSLWFMITYNMFHTVLVTIVILNT